MTSMLGSIGVKLENGVRVANELVSTSDGQSMLGGLVSKTLGLVDKVHPLTSSWEVLKGDLTTDSPLNAFLGTLDKIKWFICSAGEESWQKIAATVCFFTSGILNQVKYLGKLGVLHQAFDLNLIIRPFLLSGATFNACVEMKKLKEAKFEIIQSGKKISHWKVKLGAVDRQVDEVIGRLYKDKAREFQELAKDNLKEYLNKKATHKIEKWTTLQSNALSQKKKSLLALAYNVCSATLSALMLVGMLFSVAALGSASMFMIVAAVALAVFGIYKTIHNNENKVKAVPKQEEHLVNYKVKNGDLLKELQKISSSS